MTYQELNFDDSTVVVADFLPIVGSMFIKDSSLLFSWYNESPLPNGIFFPLFFCLMKLFSFIWAKFLFKSAQAGCFNNRGEEKTFLG